MSTRNTIIIKGDPVRDEKLAAGTITPGNILILGSADTVIRNSRVAQKVPVIVAIEDEMQGNDLTDNYASGALVQFGTFKPGDEPHVILADGQVVAIGDRVEMAAAGEVRAQATNSDGSITTPAAGIGIAKEAVDASDSAVTAVASRRLIIEVI